MEYRFVNYGWVQAAGYDVLLQGQPQGPQGVYAVGGNLLDHNYYRQYPHYVQGMGAGYQNMYYYGVPNAGDWAHQGMMRQQEALPRMEVDLQRNNHNYARAQAGQDVPVPVVQPQVFGFGGGRQAIFENVMEGSRSNANVEGAESSGSSQNIELSAELSEKVFGNEMLREKILKDVIFSSNDSVSTADLKNSRLVRKSWLVTSADIFRQRSLPMFHLTLDAENSTTESFYVKEHSSKLLANFVRFMTSSRLLNFIPPFSLHLQPGFFRYENFHDLVDCLVFCGAGLINLDLSFPVNSSLPFYGFSLFYLPQLQRLSVQYSNYRIPYGMELMNTSRITFSISMVQAILNNASEDLKELIFKYSPSQALIPHDFKTLKLPQSITKLSLDCPLNDNDLELLISNELLNLTKLSLYATNVPYSPQKITKILENLRLSLRSLSLGGGIVQRQAWNPTILRLPVMENLEFLEVTSKCWAFEEDVLERQLPRLTELQILNMREETFNRWTGTSVFPEVKKVSVSLIHENVHPYYLYSTQLPKTMTLGNMIRLNRTFPNIVSLELTIREPMIVGLKYLFDEMRSLQELTITVRGAVEIENHGPWLWDAVLTGLSEDLVKCFRRNQAYCGEMELRDNSTFPSIKKLTALKSLVLKEELTHVDPSKLKPHWALISEVTFHFALLKMPNLVNLELHGRFKASQQMAEQWRIGKGTEINGVNRQ